MILSVYDGAAYRPVACLTSNPLSESREILETKTKCNPGIVQKEYGAYSYEISCEGEYIDTTSATGDNTKASHDFLTTFIRQGNSVEWSMSTGITDTPTWYGTAFMSGLSAEPPTDETLTFSCELSGNGAITTVNPNP